MTEEEKKEKYEKENRNQLLVALALLLYQDVEKKIQTVEDIPQEIKAKLEAKIDDFLVKDKPKELNELTKPEILKMAQDIVGANIRYFKVVTIGDKKTCESCKKWEGQIISDFDKKYPSFDDLSKSGALHYNCRCYLKPISLKTSSNSSNTNQNIVFSGFYSAL